MIVLRRVVSPRIYVGPRLGAVVLAVWQVPNRSAVAVDVPVQARYLGGSVVSADRPPGCLSQRVRLPTAPYLLCPPLDR